MFYLQGLLLYFNSESGLQNHVKAALQSNAAAAALLEQHTAAAEQAEVARSAAVAAEEEHGRLVETAAAVQKILENPPPTTVLRASPVSETDTMKAMSLDQLLDYTPNDTKVWHPDM